MQLSTEFPGRGFKPEEIRSRLERLQGIRNHFIGPGRLQRWPFARIRRCAASGPCARPCRKAAFVAIVWTECGCRLRAGRDCKALRFRSGKIAELRTLVSSDRAGLVTSSPQTGVLTQDRSGFSLFWLAPFRARVYTQPSQRFPCDSKLSNTANLKMLETIGRLSVLNGERSRSW